MRNGEGSPKIKSLPEIRKNLIKLDKATDENEFADIQIFSRREVYAISKLVNERLDTEDITSQLKIALVWFQAGDLKRATVVSLQEKVKRLAVSPDNKNANELEVKNANRTKRKRTSKYKPKN